MALPTSGPLSLSDIQGEFGGSNPISLSEYYAGGGLVPSGTSGTNGPVPSSGAISISNFYGTSNATVNFTDDNVSAVGNTAQTAGYRIDVDGFVYQVVNGVSTALYQWASPTSIGGNYEVFATVTSGSVSSGTTGSWVATSTSPLWTRARPTPGTSIVELSMQVRPVGSGTIPPTWTVTLEAERF